jgi:hypothetical protein
VPKFCEFGFSDGAECLKPAVASIGSRHYCAEHYDNWMEYYRRHLFDGSGKYRLMDDGIEDVKRVLKGR